MSGERAICPICGKEHSKAYIAAKVRDLEFRQRMARGQMFASELRRADAAEAKAARVTHKGTGVGSGPETRRKVRELTDLHWSIKKIADELNVSEDTVKKARKATRV